MVPGLTSQQERALLTWASGNDRIAAITVFGSRARGDHREDSDLDLALALTEDRHNTAAGIWVCKRVEWNAELSVALGLNVRTVRPTEDDDGGIREGLAQDGIEIYRAA